MGLTNVKQKKTFKTTKVNTIVSRNRKAQFYVANVQPQQHTEMVERAIKASGMMTNKEIVSYAKDTWGITITSKQVANAVANIRRRTKLPNTVTPYQREYLINI